MEKKYLLFLNYLILLLFAGAVTILSPLLGEIAKGYSLDLAQSGFIFTAFFLGVFIFILVGGSLADRYGKKKIILLSVIGFSFSLFIFPYSPNFIVACIIMALIGGFGGASEALASALIVELMPENPGFYLNLAHVFFGAAAVIGPIGAGMLLSADLDWKICYYFLGSMALLLSILIAYSKFPAFIKQESITFAEIKKIITNKSFILICLCVFLYTGSEVGSWGWMATFLNKNLSFTVMMSSIAVGVFWFFVTLGRILCGFLSLRFSIRKIVIVLALLSAITTFLSGAVNNQALLWIVIAGLGITYSSQWPLIVSYGGSYFNTSSGTIFSIMIASGGLGTMIIPYGMGGIAQYANIRIAMMSPAVLFVVIAVIFIWFGGKKKELTI